MKIIRTVAGSCFSSADSVSLTSPWGLNRYWSLFTPCDVDTVYLTQDLNVILVKWRPFFGNGNMVVNVKESAFLMSESCLETRMQPDGMSLKWKK